MIFKFLKSITFQTFLLIIIFSLGYGCSKNKQEEVFSTKKKLFLVAGQSNARGVGDSTKAKFILNKPVYEYNSVTKKQEILQEPIGQNHLGFHKALTGSFLSALGYEYNKLTNNNVVLIQAARGGSSLTVEADINNSGNWSEKGELFTNSIFKTKQALEVVEKNSIAAIFWSQGENDASALYEGLISEKDYKHALNNLIARFKIELGNVPFIIVETGPFLNNSEKNDAYTKIRLLQREVANETEGVYIGYNETEFFAERGWLKDVVHYNQEALNDIGTKLAYFYHFLEI